jgi:hypothetical protein
MPREFNVFTICINRAAGGKQALHVDPFDNVSQLSTSQPLSLNVSQIVPVGFVHRNTYGFEEI